MRIRGVSCPDRCQRPCLRAYSHGSIGSLSSASTPTTHSCTRLSGCRCTRRSSPSIPRANSRRASERFPDRPRSRSRPPHLREVVELSVWNLTEGPVCQFVEPVKCHPSIRRPRREPEKTLDDDPNPTLRRFIDDQGDCPRTPTEPNRVRGSMGLSQQFVCRESPQGRAAFFYLASKATVRSHALYQRLALIRSAQVLSSTCAVGSSAWLGCVARVLAPVLAAISRSPELHGERPR
jgi:hypothetical protein